MPTVPDCRPRFASDQPAAIFFDVDGTLIWVDTDKIDTGARLDDFLPNDSVRDAFRRLHERGHQAYLCTGRPLTMVPQGLLDLGFAGAIAGAGSCITLGGKVVYESVIPRDVVCEAVRLLRAIDVGALLESHSQPVILSDRRDLNLGFPDIPIASSLEEVEQFAPKMEFCKITSLGEAGADWHRGGFGRLIDEYFSECDMGLSRELSLKGVDKGAGVRRVLELTGHGRANTFAFGDSENDLPMFPEVETPIAMGNAMGCVKERASYVTGHANADGIASALEHFGLI